MTVTEEPQAGEPETNPGYKWVGTRPIRPDGYDKVTGKARFGADLKLPGQLEGAVLRSPHAHARISSIDTATAESMPGVKAVITGADFPDLTESGASAGDVALSKNIMARDKVFYEGHVVAAVAATTRRQAREAAAAIDVTYEVLDHVLTVDEAMAEGAPLLHDDLVTKNPAEGAPEGPSNIASRVVFERGDLDKGFADADVVVEREFTTKPVHQGYIEPHACVADAGSDGKAHLWVSSQGHFAMRAYTATMLGWDTGRLKVTPAEIGGGFGGKTVIYLEPLAVRLSEKAGRPVRIVMGRDEVFKATGPTSGTRMTVKMGVTNDGTFTAADCRLYYEAGAFPGSPVGAGGMTAIACYGIDTFVIEGFDVVGQQAEGRGLPGPGRADGGVRGGERGRRVGPEDRHGPDRAAAQERVGRGHPGRLRSQVPPHRVRGDPGGDPRLRALLDRAGAQPGSRGGRWILVQRRHELQRHRARQRGRHDDGRDRFARHRWQPGLDGPDGGRGDGDRDRPDPAGGGRHRGRGVQRRDRREPGDDGDRGRRHRVLPADQGRPPGPGLQDVGPRRSGRCFSRRRRVGRRSGPDARRQSDAVDAGRHLGQVGPDRWSDLGHRLAQLPGRGGRVLDPALRSRGRPRDRRGHDPAVHHRPGCRHRIHPSYVEGQMQGGVVQGIGWALNEEYIHRPDGTLDNASFLDYRIPVASDLPMIETIVVEVPNPAHPYGVRGVGEVGIVPPLAAVANAIEAATGCRHEHLPISPVRVLEEINHKNEQNGG